MRQMSGTTTIFKAVLIFTFIFAAFLSVAINYNKAYRIKNQAINILEKYEGVNTKSLDIISNYLKSSAYSYTGKCNINDGEFGISDLDNPHLSKNANENYYYCLKSKFYDGRIYYTIKVFFNFELPFFGQLGVFKITGDTKGIKAYSNNQLLR